MPKKSLCFLTNAYPDFESSARGIFVKKMALFFTKEGYRICVVTPKIFQRSPTFEDLEGVKIYRFPFFSQNRLLIEYERIPYLRMLFYFISGAAFTLYALLRNRCRLIHVHWVLPTGMIGVLVGFLLSKPMVVTIHGSDFRMAVEGPAVLKRAFVFICRRARFLTCVNEMMSRRIEQMGIEREKISTFPVGIDQTFLKVGENRRKRESQPITILSNRNFHPIYNVSLLIRAIPLVIREEPKLRFLIVGEGPQREMLEEEVRRLDLRPYVQFLGRVPPERMPELLAEADIYVSTSLSDGTSVSLLEAMAAGTFPIVTAIPSNLEWVADGKNGFIVLPDAEDLLARKVIEAIRNRTLVEESRNVNLAIIRERALWCTTLEKTREIYRGILEIGDLRWHRDCS